ncbi:MAG: tetratricopeptide repeat protein [Spirochaetales bacterium]|nr:tetratricopeptide repeat protein [Spirochaetales bacterium]
MKKPILSVLLVCVFFPVGLVAEEAGKINYDEYYRFPFSMAVEYQSLSPFDDYGARFNIFEVSGTGRIPFPKTPSFQAQVNAGYLRFDSWDEDHPDRWDHYHLFGGAGLAFSSRFTRDFEIGTDIIAGFSEAVFPFLSSLETAGAPYFFASLGGHIALDPSYNISVNLHPRLRYQYCLLKDVDFSDFDGFALSLGAAIHYRFGDDPDSSRGIIRSIAFQDISISPMFAAMQSYYNAHPFGSVKLKNTEKVRIEDVSVSFFQAGMMDAPTNCCSFGFLEPGETVTANLLAAYNQEVFRTEGITPMTGEIIVHYTMRGRPAEQRQSISYDLYDKTALTWDDDAKAAAFITPADSALRNYMTFIKNAAREYSLTTWSEPVQTAMQVYHALAELGLVYQVDPTSPFSVAKGDPFVVDSISLPRDTLKRTSGDCDDLTVLFASMLECVGIPSGYITVPGHIFPVFDTGIPIRDYRNLNPQRDMSISLGNTLWLPVEITLVGQGNFLEAWRKACEAWNAWSEEPDKRHFLRTAEAREIYRPVGLREADLGLQYGDPEALAASFAADFTVLQDLILSDYLETARVKNRKQDFNALGVMYSLFGRYKESEEAFTRALRLDKNYVAAKVNRGNVAFLAGDYPEAIRQYNQVLNDLEDPAGKNKNMTVLLMLNLSKSYYGAENFTEAKNYFDRAKEIDPEAVKGYGYLGGTDGGDGTRSSDARSTGLIMFAPGEEE